MDHLPVAAAAFVAGASTVGAVAWLAAGRIVWPRGRKQQRRTLAEAPVSSPSEFVAPIPASPPSVLGAISAELPEPPVVQRAREDKQLQRWRWLLAVEDVDGAETALRGSIREELRACLATCSASGVLTSVDSDDSEVPSSKPTNCDLSAVDALASLCSDTGRLDEAEKLHRSALAASALALGCEHKSTVMRTVRLATNLRGQGRLLEAELQLRAALRRLERRLGASSHGKAVEDAASTTGAAGALSSRDRLRRRASAAQIAARVAAGGSSLPPEPLPVLSLVAALAETLLQREVIGEACTLLRRAHTGFAAQRGHAHPTTLRCARALALALAEDGRLEEAEPLLRTALTAVRERRFCMEDGFIATAAAAGEAYAPPAGAAVGAGASSTSGAAARPVSSRKLSVSFASGSGITLAEHTSSAASTSAAPTANVSTPASASASASASMPSALRRRAGLSPEDLQAARTLFSTPVSADSTSTTIAQGPLSIGGATDLHTSSALRQRLLQEAARPLPLTAINEGRHREQAAAFADSTAARLASAGLDLDLDIEEASVSEELATLLILRGALSDGEALQRRALECRRASAARAVTGWRLTSRTSLRARTDMITGGGSGSGIDTDSDTDSNVLDSDTGSDSGSGSDADAGGSHSSSSSSSSDVHILACLSSLASCIMRQGRPLEAESLLREAVRLSERIFGAKHPETLNRLEALVAALEAGASAKTSSAPASASASASSAGSPRYITGRPAPLASPQSSPTTGSTGAATPAQGARYVASSSAAAASSAVAPATPAALSAEALALQERVLAGRRERLGLCHPDTVHSTRCLAALMRRQGNADGAARLLATLPAATLTSPASPASSTAASAPASAPGSARTHAPPSSRAPAAAPPSSSLVSRAFATASASRSSPARHATPTLVAMSASTSTSASASVHSSGAVGSAARPLRY